MRRQDTLARDTLAMADFSVRNSEKIRLMSIYTAIMSALVVIGVPMTASGASMYAQQIPIYIMAFSFIFLFSLLGEYAAVWLSTEKSVHLCRSACNIMVAGMALFELFLFFNLGSEHLEGIERPFSISTLFARLLS